MPAIILSNQRYRAGETPIFLAFLYGLNGEPLTFYQEGEEERYEEMGWVFNPDNKVKSIFVTHSQERDGIVNGMFITSWYPVTHPNGTLENVEILPSHILGVPVPLIDTDLNRSVQNWTALNTRFAVSPANGRYNFVYIPLNGRHFYPEPGVPYRTIFHLELMNGKTDMMIFETEVVEDERLLERHPRPMLSVGYGENVVFTGDLYGLYKEDNGQLNFMGEDDTGKPILRSQRVLDEIAEFEEELSDKIDEIVAKEAEVNPLIDQYNGMDDDEQDSPAGIALFNQIQDLLEELTRLQKEEAEIREKLRDHINLDAVRNVYLTVFHTNSHQRIIDREPIGVNDVVLTAVRPRGTGPFDYNFTYTFQTNRLPREGEYRFRFDIETRGKINPLGIEGERGIPCTFDIDVAVV